MFSYFKGINYIKLAKDIIFRIKDDDVSALASQLAYSLLLSFFPFLIFLLTLVGFSPISTQQAILSLNKIFPKEVYTLIDKIVTEVFAHKSSGLLSFGIIVMTVVSSNGFGAVMKGLNKAYDEDERRSFIRRQLVSLICTFGIALILIFSILLLVFGETNGRMISMQLNLGIKFSIIWNGFRYIVMLVVMSYIFALVYRFTPSRRLTLTEVYPGAIFTTIGWVIASQIFSFYIENFGNYSRVYGSIGAVIIMLTWLFIISIILLIGGEINAAIVHQKKLEHKL